MMPFRQTLFLLILTISTVFAQDVQIAAVVSSNRIGLNETFEYKVEINGQSSGLPDPSFPAFNPFSVLSGPNTSTSIQIINGRMSSSKGYSFYLQAQQEGQFTIPPATITVDGKTISSNEITMTVVKGQAQTGGAQPAPGQPRSTRDAEIAGENLFLKAEVDKRNVYQNEQITVIYKLYFRVNVRSYNYDKIPANAGFWTEEYAQPSQPPINNEVVNGITYQVATLRKLALFPTQNGELTIEPLVVSVDALVKRPNRSRSFFDSFFDDPFGQTVRTSLSSKPVTVHVKPLPESNRPAGFANDVGRYSLTATLDKKELKVNEAASIKMTINGEGNLKLLKPPTMTLPPDLEVYEPKEATTIKRDAGAISGTKSIEYIIVPRLAGEYQIKPLTLSYFDPKSGKYNTVSTAALKLKVLPGAAGSGMMASGSSLSKQEVALLGEDIRFIKETTKFFSAGKTIYTKWWYLGTYLLPIAGLVLTILYVRQRDKMRSDLRLARRRKAGKIAAKHLTAARKVLKTGSQNEFYRRISQALQGFVSDRLNLQMTDFNVVTVQKNLEQVGVGPEEITEYQECLTESDFRQFAGTNVNLQQMKDFYERVKRILTRLERYI
jgi:hypothetical protein